MELTPGDEQIIRDEIAKAEAALRPLDIRMYAHGKAGNEAARKALESEALEKARLIKALQDMLPKPPEPAKPAVPAETASAPAAAEAES